MNSAATKHMTKDSAVILQKTLTEFNQIKAKLNTVVTNRDEMTYLLDENMPIQFSLHENIQQIVKIKIEGKLSPLKFFFTYPENPVVKMLAVYVSYDKKDPIATQSYHELKNNPKIIEILGTSYDPKTS